MTYKPSWRDQLAYRLASVALRLATPTYRDLLEGAWRMGLTCAAAHHPGQAEVEEMPLACWEKQLVTEPFEQFTCSLATGHDGPCVPTRNRTMGRMAMNVGELKSKLDGLPDDMPIVVEYDRGSAESAELAVAVEDGVLVLDASPWPHSPRTYR
jgi:hypothetical protein